MCMDIVDWEGGCDMQRVEVNVKGIVREVAELPVEEDKEKVLHLNKSRKKRDRDRKHTKWLGVIFDDPVHGL